MTISLAVSSTVSLRLARRRSALAVALAGLFASLPAFALAPGEEGLHVLVPISGTVDVARGASVDSTGRLLMAGDSASGFSALARLLRNGNLDASLGGDGIAAHDLSSGGDTLRALAPMEDGRSVVCGTFFGAGTASDFLAARFGEDGALDATFDGIGYAATPFLDTGTGVLLFDECHAVALQPDGAVVSAGVTYEGGGPSVALTRHLADGTLDGSFGIGGKVDIHAAANPNGSSEANAVAIQADGRIVVAGYAFGSGNSDLLLMRLDADGTPDATFGVGGIVRTQVEGGEDIAHALVIEPDGRLVVAGSATASDNRRDFVVARYLTDGAPDASFGNGGLVTTPVGPADDIAYALLRMPWGRLVAAGYARVDVSASGIEFAVVAYNADGSLDRYFGDGGVQRIDESPGDDIAYALASDLDGEHFWMVGTAEGPVSQDFAAIELGLPDTIFRHGYDSATAP